MAEGDEEVARFDVGIGGHLCLDFVNTVGGRISNPGRAADRDYRDLVVRDGLTNYADVVDWGVDSGALCAAEAEELHHAGEERPVEADTIHGRAVDLREAIYRLLKCVIEGWQPGESDVVVLNRELQEARRHESVAAAEGSFRWQWDRDSRLLGRVLWPVASSAAELLTGPELGRVGQCGGEGCGWLFMDRSRAGRRRWCDMRVCGNRAKVRRHRERNQAGSLETRTTNHF